MKNKYQKSPELRGNSWKNARKTEVRRRKLTEASLKCPEGVSPRAFSAGRGQFSSEPRFEGIFSWIAEQRGQISGLMPYVFKCHCLSA